MSNLRINLLILLSLCISATGAESEPNKPVAIVYSLTGEASLMVPGTAPRSLRLFDELRAAVRGLADLDRRLEEEHGIKRSFVSIEGVHQPLDIRVNPLFSILPAAPNASERENGAVVEAVGKGWAADRAGIQPGDLLLSWSRGEGGGGPVRSPFDLGQLEVEQAPLGMITLRGTREGRSWEWIVPPGSWRIWARPNLSEVTFEFYDQGLTRITKGDLEAGLRHWRSAVEIADRRKDPLQAAWLLACLADELLNAARWSEAEEALKEAVERLEESQPAAGAQLLAPLLSQWNLSATVNSLNIIEPYLLQALAVAPENSLSAAWNLRSLGDIRYRLGDFVSAEDLFRKAHAIQEKLAPGSSDIAYSLTMLAMIAGHRGDLDGAQNGLLKSLEILERTPESLEFAIALNGLGMIAFARGDLSTAEEFYRRALGIFEKVSPYHQYFAGTLSLLGVVDMHRGALAISEEHLRRALDLYENLAPESHEVARSLHELGNLAQKRGDLAAAEAYYKRSFDIDEKMAHDSSEMSFYRLSSLKDLAAVETRKGNFGKADDYLRRVFEIQNKMMPESYDMASTCSLRALVAVERGNLILAEQLHGRALMIREKQSPGGLAVSDSLEGLGIVAFEQGNLAKAREFFGNSLDIREKMAPGSTQVGLSLNYLGQVARREGRLAMAVEPFCRAADAFEQQRKKLGGTTEGRFAFGGRTAESFHDCLAALVDVGRTAEAFRVLERGRARSFLDLLTERDLRWEADLPPELARDRKQMDTEYDRTQAALERLSPVHDQTEIDRLLVRLQELRARQGEIAAKIRQASPRAAALQDPQPLDLAGARSSLDPGTLLLAWSIGRERSFLFVVQPEGTDPSLEVFPLAVGDQALRERVESFLNLLRRANSDQVALSGQARELYDILLRPAEARIATAARLLVSPDGPLHILPFAALIRNDRWLAEEKPVHSVLSVTVYADLKKARRPAADRMQGPVVAFGNPVYPKLPKDRNTAPAATLEILTAVRRGLSLRPLPATRKEVEAIANLFPGARTYLGREATEERAKAVSSQARVLHFACHGLLDERFPLNSALALTIPENPGEGQDNGLLQAWEIFESMRLDADLVTLSACDSGLGQEMGGEGLLGLTRAFQYAGAHSVLAALWSVSDNSTADLMKRFYGYLREGRSKDEALRAAQVELIHSKDFSHPYHWAAFQLTGDWK